MDKSTITNEVLHSPVSMINEWYKDAETPKSVNGLNNVINQHEWNASCNKAA